MSRTLQNILIAVAGVVSFLFFLVMLFPLDTAVGDYLAKIESLTGGKYRVMISEMDTSLIFDSRFEGFRIERKKGESFEEILNVPRVRMRLSLWALFSKSASLNFESEFEEGSIDGLAVFSEDDMKLDLNFSQFAVERVRLLRDLLHSEHVSLGIHALVDGHFYFYGPIGRFNARSIDMRMNLRVSDFRLHDIKAKIVGQDFYISELVLSPKEGYARIEVEMENGRLTFPNISLPGSDIELQLSGHMNVNNRFVVIRSSLNGKFAFSETLVEKLPVLAMINDQRKADGYYPLTVSGAFARPEVRIGNLNLSEMLGF